MTITVADIEAATEVVRQLTNESDSGLELPQIVALRAACKELGKAVKDAESLLETAAIGQLETGAARTVGSTTFGVSSKPKLVPNQERVKQQIVRFVTVNPVTGEKRRGSVADAVERTIDVMYDLFVAPSSMPKAGGLKKLKLKIDDFCTEEPGKKSLVEVIEG